MREPPCFLLFHVEEKQRVVRCSSSSACGLVRTLWRLKKRVLFGLPGLQEDMGWDGLLQNPERISEPTRHRRGANLSSMLCLPQLLMRPAHIVGAADHVHAPLKRLQTPTGMTTGAWESCQTFSHRGMQSFKKGGRDVCSTM